MTTRAVALLRAINLGGINKVPMKELTGIFAQCGCKDVETYIQSGNVVFNAPAKTLARLPGAISTEIAERWGHRVPVVLRTATELHAAIENNPFLKAGADVGLLHLAFLADAPDESAIAASDRQRSIPDEFAIVGRDLYLMLPNGVGRTKFTNAYFDSKLRTVSTIRNWRTVLKLWDMVSKG